MTESTRGRLVYIVTVNCDLSGGVAMASFEVADLSFVNSNRIRIVPHLEDK